jgi:hypothetical protein
MGRRGETSRVYLKTVKPDAMFHIFSKGLSAREYPAVHKPGAATAQVKGWLAGRAPAAKK